LETSLCSINRTKRCVASSIPVRWCYRWNWQRDDELHHVITKLNSCSIRDPPFKHVLVSC